MWFINMKSRVQGDFHARFRGNVGVKFPCVTRLPAQVYEDNHTTHIDHSNFSVLDRLLHSDKDTET